MSSGDKLHKKIIKKFPKGRCCVKRSSRDVVETLEMSLTFKFNIESEILRLNGIECVVIWYFNLIQFILIVNLHNDDHKKALN